MLSRGYDGLVYNEGGDRPDQKHTTSYVFYNPEKIGTYETWHEDKIQEKTASSMLGASRK